MADMTEEQKKRMEEEQKRLDTNLQDIQNKIAVFSGKGGVGKTTVSVNLACGLQKLGVSTGILDADVTGPNVPKMLGLQGRLASRNSQIVPLDYHGVKVISIASMLDPDQPVIWRGPMRSKLISQFLSDADWGNLSYLIADLPPGTGDEILTIMQKMKPNMAIIVTTPQDVSVMDARRAIRMAQKMKIPHIAVIENMSGLICPHCGEHIDLFGVGGGEKQAIELDIPFLGALPVDFQARQLSDEGKSYVFELPDAPITQITMDIAKKLKEIITQPVSANVG